MYKVTAIVQAGQGTGFTFAGVHVRESSSATEAHNILGTEIDDGHNGIILIDEKFTADFSTKLQKRVDESTIPLVVSIPVITKWEYVRGRDEIIENIIRRAVGYSIKVSGETD